MSMNSLIVTISGPALAGVKQVVDLDLVRTIADSAARRAAVRQFRLQGFSWGQARVLANPIKSNADMQRIVKSLLERGTPLELAQDAAVPFY